MFHGEGDNNMFWDKVAPAYDLFETVYNAKVYRNTGERVAVEIDENDMVLECACGTQWVQ